MRREKVKFVSLSRYTPLDNRESGSFWVRIGFETPTNETYSFPLDEKTYNSIVKLKNSGQVFFAEWKRSIIGPWIDGSPAGLFEHIIPDEFKFITDDGEEF